MNSYSPPPPYYLDIEFKCADCGREETWTAEQQKWYYEVAKGSRYSTAVRCRKCRRRRKQSAGQGDPRPIKHRGTIYKRIRAGIASRIRNSGFSVVRSVAGGQLSERGLVYSRPGLMLSCRIDQRKGSLIAETLDDKSECRVVARVKLSRSDNHAKFLRPIDRFIEAVKELIQSLPESGQTQQRE